ncbi:hypothetical protein [Candidatus Spongiihabitans sp.]
MPIICHCPAHIIIGRAIQWNMPSGVAGLIMRRSRAVRCENEGRATGTG